MVRRAAAPEGVEVEAFSCSDMSERLERLLISSMSCCCCLIRFFLWPVVASDAAAKAVAAAAAKAAAAAALLALEGRPTGLPVDVFAFLGLTLSEPPAAAEEEEEEGLGGLTTETLPDAVRPLLMFLMALVVLFLKVKDLCFGGGGGGSGSDRFAVVELDPEAACGRERFLTVVVVGDGVGILMLGMTMGIFKLMEVEVFNPVPATSLFLASSKTSCSSLMVGLLLGITVVVFDDTIELKLLLLPSFFPSLAFRR